MHDPDEPALAGSLLWARHGKGTFVYTGLAFFRQLPAGRARRVPAVREPAGGREGERNDGAGANGASGGDGEGAAGAPARDGRRAAIPHLARDLRRRAGGAGRRRSCWRSRWRRLADERARLGRPRRHARLDRRVRPVEDARAVEHGRLRPRRLPRSLADDRPRRHGDAGVARSPSCRCRGRRTRTACASCSSTSACRSRWWCCRVVFMPRFYRLRVLTAYEYLEGALRSEDAAAGGVPVPVAARAVGRA